MFSVEERVAFLEEALRDAGQRRGRRLLASSSSSSRSAGARSTMVKGLRVISDFEWEFQMNHLNRTLAPDVETVYLMSNPQYSFVSSSGVKEVASFGGNVDELVPRGRRTPLQGDVPAGEARRAGLPAGMSRRAAGRSSSSRAARPGPGDVVGARLSRSPATGPRTMPRFPGRIAVRDGCGLRHMCVDGTDSGRCACQDVFDAVSVSRNGDTLAWDTTRAATASSSRGRRRLRNRSRAGSARVDRDPSLSPDGNKVAFLHSAQDDGRTTSGSARPRSTTPSS